MKILFLGDFFFDYLQIPSDLNKIVDFINDNDYKVILNLECSLSRSKFPVKKRGPNLCSSEITLKVLKALNVIAVSLANNHAMDFGEEGLMETIAMLENAGIVVVGAGKNLDEANKVRFINIDNKKIQLMAFGWDVEETIYATDNKPGCAPLDREKIIQQVKKIKCNNSSIPIVMMLHWGFEYNRLPMPIDIKFAHDCNDAGIDLIIGGHPHVVQPYEIRNKHYIFYSLGNFYFSSRRKLFNITFKNEPINNLCDYGIGVILNVEDLSIDQLPMFFYDKSSNESSVKDVDQNVLYEFTYNNWFNKEYEHLCKLHKNNINPVLTLNKGKNKRKIKTLFFAYFFSNRLKKLKKNKIGKNLYDFLKNIMKK